MGTSSVEPVVDPAVDSWAPFRSRIEELYLQQGSTVHHVLSILERENGFKATLVFKRKIRSLARSLTFSRPNQFKRKIAAWGITKNISSEDMERISQKLLQTHRRELMERTTDQEVEVYGHIVKISKVKRYLKRKGNLVVDGESDSVSSVRDFAEDGASSVQNNDGDHHSWLSSLDYSEPPKFKENREDVSSSIGDDPSNLQSYSECGSWFPSPVDRSKRTDSGYITDGSMKRKRHNNSDSVERVTKPLACPFSKHYPERFSDKNTVETKYRSCATALLRDIPRLKQHLHRVHGTHNQCPRCYKSFSSFRLLSEHLNLQPRCKVLAKPVYSDTMSKDQESAIKKREIGRSDSDSWYRIYSILFPGDRKPESPYAGEFDIDEMTSVRHFVNLFRAIDQSTLETIRKSVQSPHFPSSTRAVVDSACERMLPEPYSQEMIELGSNDTSWDTIWDSQPELHSISSEPAGGYPFSMSSFEPALFESSDLDFWGVQDLHRSNISGHPLRQTFPASTDHTTKDAIDYLDLV